MKKLEFILLVLSCINAGRAATISVPGQYPTIQSAIIAASEGDIIVAEPNIYYENINFLGKAITVRSVEPNDANVVAATVIDGSRPLDPNIGSVVTFTTARRLLFSLIAGKISDRPDSINIII